MYSILERQQRINEEGEYHESLSVYPLSLTYARRPDAVKPYPYASHCHMNFPITN